MIGAFSQVFLLLVTLIELNYYVWFVFVARVCAQFLDLADSPLLSLY